MQIHSLKITYKRKRVKRIGRGGKRGSFSGHGIKGQKSRAGHKIRPAERDLIQRLPKLRGFRFKSIKAKVVGVNLADLEKKIKSGIINTEALIKAGLVKKSDKRIKILAKGEVKRPIEVVGIKVSEGAKKKIESAGGKLKQS